MPRLRRVVVPGLGPVPDRHDAIILVPTRAGSRYTLDLMAKLQLTARPRTALIVAIKRSLLLFIVLIV